MSAEGLRIDELERWVLFGARWRAVRVGDDRAVVDLCTCTGELVERRESVDPEVIDYVRRHHALPPVGDDDPPLAG